LPSPVHVATLVRAIEPAASGTDVPVTEHILDLTPAVLCRINSNDVRDLENLIEDQIASRLVDILHDAVDQPVDLCMPILLRPRIDLSCHKRLHGSSPFPKPYVPQHPAASSNPIELC